METFLDNVPAIIQIASLIVAAAALIASMTPTPKDDGYVRKARQVIDFLGLNFGHARNKDQ